MALPESRQESGPQVLDRETLDGAALLRWGRICLAGLEERRAEIDALNVFPIPDGDTGTNLLATMRAAVSAAESAVRTGRGDTAAGESVRPLSGDGGYIATSAGTPEEAGARRRTEGGDGAVRVSAHPVAAAMARGATAGARGNSGIILSQVLRGIAEAAETGPLTGETYRAALARAAALVRAGLSTPVEGTVLTVLDRAGRAAADCADPGLAAVAAAAAEGAALALADTPTQLGVLAEAGVVDAGARGLLVLLDSAVALITGRPPVRPEYRRGGPGHAAAPDRRPTAGYEVMYRIAETDERRVADLRRRLAELGDSVVVVGDGERTWSAHVHCADAGAAVEAGLAAGALHGIRIESFAVAPHGCAERGAPWGRDGATPEGCIGARSWTDRVSLPRAEGAADTGSPPREPDTDHDRGVLAVASGAGAVALFEASGAVVVSGAGPVDTAMLLAAIRRMPHREVLVLPNGALPAQELVAVGVAARHACRDVLLLPSGCMVQGLAALAVHDRARIAVDDAFAMSEAAAATRWGSLRVARGRALTMVGTCETGDGLGLVGHDVVVIDRDVRAAGRILLDRMLGLGGELVTLLVGAAAPPGLVDELGEHIGAEFPGVEVTVYTGGQHGDLVQIGVE